MAESLNNTKQNQKLSWQYNQIEFIQKCIEKHGQNRLWQQDENLQVTLEKLSGLIPQFKKATRFFKKPIQVVVTPTQQKVEFRNCLEVGDVAIYRKGDVSYQSSTEKLQSLKHRQTFKGFKKLRSWSLLDTTYFFGYAITTYYSVPSILTQLELIEEVAVKHNGHSLRGFKVRFDKNFDTHSEVQTFFFNEEHLLVRHDYTADVIGPVAFGSHFTTDYVLHEGVQVATERKVFARLGLWVSPVLVLKAQISN